MGQDHPYSSWRLATEVLGGCPHVAEIAYSSGAQGSGRGRMSETAGHGQPPLHGRLRTAVNLTNMSAATSATAGARSRHCGKATPKGNVSCSPTSRRDGRVRSGREAPVERRLEAMRATAASGLE